MTGGIEFEGKSVVIGVPLTRNTRRSFRELEFAILLSRTSCVLHSARERPSHGSFALKNGISHLLPIINLITIDQMLKCGNNGTVNSSLIS